MRAWTGPTLLSYGFRLFFLAGALWAALAMAIWISMLTGLLRLPTRFDPVSWHAHEFLFGYLGAIFAGFLLTAVPNWTGRLPVVGWRLGALGLLWAAGRLAVAISSGMAWTVAATVDLAFPVVLGAVLLREILAGRTWKNLPVLGLLVLFAVGNGLFHWQAAQGDVAANGSGMRLGISTALMMIALVGGRIVPSFTRNWLVRNRHPARPAPPMQYFDRVVLLASIAALTLWVLWPLRAGTGIALIVMGILHVARLVRWRGWHAGAEPLVWVLHAGYAFVPLGALASGFGTLAPSRLAPAAMQHLWMAGAIGLMTLAVMTRATLGHTGHDLHAGPGTTALYGMLIGSVAARLLAGIWPAVPLLELAGLLWIGAFAGFALLFGPLLLGPKQTRG